MKNIFCYLLFIIPIIGFSQTLEIDAVNPIKSSEIIVEKGMHSLKIDNFEKIESFKIEKDYKIQPMLSSESNWRATDITVTPVIKTFDLEFKDNTIYTITIKSEGVDTIKKYIFKSVSNWSWTTTFGANAIFLTNPNSYKTIKRV